MGRRPPTCLDPLDSRQSDRGHPLHNVRPGRWTEPDPRRAVTPPVTPPPRHREGTPTTTRDDRGCVLDRSDSPWLHKETPLRIDLRGGFLCLPGVDDPSCSAEREPEWGTPNRDGHRRRRTSGREDHDRAAPVWPKLVSQSLYVFDVSLRSSTVLGLVGLPRCWWQRGHRVDDQSEHERAGQQPEREGRDHLLDAKPCARGANRCPLFFARPLQLEQPRRADAAGVVCPGVGEEFDRQD
jgi:hypothetical protein